MTRLQSVDIRAGMDNPDYRSAEEAYTYVSTRGHASKLIPRFLIESQTAIVSTGVANFESSIYANGSSH